MTLGNIFAQNNDHRLDTIRQLLNNSRYTLWYNTLLCFNYGHFLIKVIKKFVYDLFNLMSLTMRMSVLKYQSRFLDDYCP